MEKSPYLEFQSAIRHQIVNIDLKQKMLRNDSIKAEHLAVKTF